VGDTEATEEPDSERLEKFGDWLEDQSSDEELIVQEAAED